MDSTDFGMLLLAVGFAVSAFSLGNARHATDDYSACQAYCYPTGIDNGAREALDACVCQGGN